MSPGRILFLQRVFPPATGAAGAMLHELGGFLAERGWEVQVVCGSESEFTTHQGLIQVHSARIPDPSRNLLLRALSMFRSRAALEQRAKSLPKPDLVVSLTDPPGLMVTGARVARHHGVPHVHWSQDVYPEIAWRMGVLSRKNPIARHLWNQSRNAIAESAAVISISDCMTRLLRQLRIPPEKIHTIPNWASSLPSEFPDEPKVREELKPARGPQLVYAGNFGRVHEFQTLLHTAAAAPGWTFLLVGDGPRKREIETGIKQMGLKNVQLLPRQSATEYTQLQRLATANCVTLAAAAAGCVMPSKIYSSLASGRPVVFIGPESSDAHRLAAKCGVSVRNGEAAELARRLNHWDSRQAEEWSLRAQKLAADYTLPNQAQKIEEVFSAVLSGREMTPD